MLDFNNKLIFKLKAVDNSLGKEKVGMLLVEGENIIYTFQSMRDFVIFTNKRIISVNVQGITGKKVDFSSMPFSKIQAFSVETAGTFDLDSELELWFSALGKVKFEFSGNFDIKDICSTISKFVL